VAIQIGSRSPRHAPSASAVRRTIDGTDMESWELPRPQKIVYRLGYWSILAIGLALTALALLFGGQIEPHAERLFKQRSNQTNGRVDLEQLASELLLLRSTSQMKCSVELDANEK
jgi:hypothetical protein